MSIQNVAIIGLGLLGGSIGLALRERAPSVVTTGFDADPHVVAVSPENVIVQNEDTLRGHDGDQHFIKNTQHVEIM